MNNKVEVKYMSFVSRITYEINQPFYLIWVGLLILIGVLKFEPFFIVLLLVLFVLSLIKIVYDSMYFVTSIEFYEDIVISFYKYNVKQDKIVLKGKIDFELISGGFFAFSSDFLLVTDNGNKVIKIRRIGDWNDEKMIKLVKEKHKKWECNMGNPSNKLAE